MKQSISIKLFLDHPFLYSESQTIKNYCSILVYILCVVTLCLKSNDSPGRRAAAKIKRMSQEVKNWKEVVVDGEQQGQVTRQSVGLLLGPGIPVDQESNRFLLLRGIVNQPFHKRFCFIRAKVVYVTR